MYAEGTNAEGNRKNTTNEMKIKLRESGKINNNDFNWVFFSHASI